MEEELFFARYLEPLKERLIRTAWRIVRQAGLAEEVLQETMLTVWKKRERVMTHPCPEALVMRICIHSAYDLLRRKGRRQEKEIAWERVIISAPAEDSPDKMTVHVQCRTEIQAAISELPRQQASAVYLRLVEERPFSEVARIMGCAEVTVRLHLYRGRRKLCRSLAHWQTGGGER